VVGSEWVDEETWPIGRVCVLALFCVANKTYAAGFEGKAPF
jgi:hypothetical protein